jgi:hypothetical protein
VKNKGDIAVLIGGTLKEVDTFIQKVNASVPERATHSKIARILRQLPPEKRIPEEVIVVLGGRSAISLSTVSKEQEQSRKAVPPIITSTERRRLAEEEYPKPRAESQARLEEAQSAEVIQVALTEEQIGYLQKHRIDYLYHITSIVNLDKILKHGILSHNEAYRLGLIAEDISMKDVQERRIKLDTIHHRCLHDYASLYFCPRNAMLFKRADLQDHLAILAVEPRVIFAPLSVFTDGNAASGPTRFYNRASDLDRLAWDVLTHDYWNNYPDGKRKKCAEVLVYPKVPTRLIHKVLVSPMMGFAPVERFVKQYPNIEFDIDLDFFFLYAAP